MLLKYQFTIRLVPDALSVCASSSHQLLFSQSFLIDWIDVRHLGHLCVVVLNLSRQKGMRQQPATQLQKKKEEEENKMSANLVAYANNCHNDCTGPTRCDYILMQISYIHQDGGNGFIPNQSCHETHHPGDTADRGKSLCHDELLALWTLCPGWT